MVSAISVRSFERIWVSFENDDDGNDDDDDDGNDGNDDDDDDDDDDDEDVVDPLKMLLIRSLICFILLRYHRACTSRLRSIYSSCVVVIRINRKTVY